MPTVPAQLIPVTTRPANRKDALPTGIRALDKLLCGGLPRGAISEIVGRPGSGKGGLLFSLMSAATRRGERVAYVDAFDCLDPPSARRAGIELDLLLWVRCRQDNRDEQAQRALKVADILTRSAGFPLIILDLELPVPPTQNDFLAGLPQHCWFRLKRILRGQRTTLLLLARRPCSASAAGVVLNLKRQIVHWHFPIDSDGQSGCHNRLLRGISSEIELSRGKGHGRITIHSHFQL